MTLATDRLIQVDRIIRRCLPDCLKSLNACLPTNLRALLKRYHGVYHE